MRQTVHPAMFLGTVILLCAAWLWARPPVPLVQGWRAAHRGPRSSSQRSRARYAILERTQARTKAAAISRST